MGACQAGIDARPAAPAEHCRNPLVPTATSSTNRYVKSMLCRCYDHVMVHPALLEIDRRMHISNRILVLSLLLALAAPDAHAGWSLKKKPAAPVAPPAPVAPLPPPPAPPPPQMVYSGNANEAPTVAPIDVLSTASSEVQATARWIAATHDNLRLNYMLLDKVNAQVYVFNPKGQLVATAPVLLGMGTGDRMLVPNATEMPAIPPSKRITPAGRFQSRLARDYDGKEVLILDYDAALSLHPVAKGTPVERRAARLASPTASDNRISFGCINVPTRFYKEVVSPTVANTWAMVYILPETGTASALFGFKADEPAPASPVAPASGSNVAGQQVSAAPSPHAQR